MYPKMSIAQRDLLIAHIDGPQPAAVKEGPTRHSLMDRKMLKSCDRNGSPRNRTLPIHYTAITDLGRDTMAEILAEYAEALIKAGCLEPSAVEISLMPFQDDQLSLLNYEPGAKETLNDTA